MKKIIVAILAVCLLICCCACQEKQTETLPAGVTEDAYMKVFFQDGSTETMTLGALTALMQTDMQTYNEKYARNEIEMVTTITKYEPHYEMNGFVRVNFEGGWNCYIDKRDAIVEQLDDRIAVKVTGTLINDGYTLYNANITVLE